MKYDTKKTCVRTDTHILFLSASLPSALDGGECPGSRYDRLTSGERIASTYWVGSSMDFRGCMKSVGCGEHTGSNMVLSFVA